MVYKKIGSSKVIVKKMNALEFTIHKHICNVWSFFRCGTLSQF